MGVIYPDRSARARRNRPSKARKYFRVIFVIAILFTLVNLAIAGYYRHRTYPRTMVANVNLGTIQTEAIDKQAMQQNILPKAIVLSYQGKRASIPLKDIGMQPYPQRAEESLKRSRSPLPLLNLFIKHTIAAPVEFDDIALQAYGEKLLPTFHQPPKNAKLTLTGSSFGVEKGKDGYDLSISRLKDALLAGIDTGETTIPAPVKPKAPKYTDAQARADARKLQASTKANITIKAGATTITPGPNDIASWFAPEGASFTLNDTLIKGYILKASIQAGTRPQNLAEAITKAKEAITAQKATSVTLVPFATTKTFRYCVGLKGIDQSHLKAFQDSAKDILADPRGWGLEGQVIFEQTIGTCDFTLWLAKADQMPSFGEICDPEWSCRIGPHVVINFDRWQLTSPAWRQHGGSLEDYRRMVINHETGHWFGFDHSTCAGAGQVAPVMMQQSINLGGCVFNPWPITAELTVYRNVLGL